MNSTSEESVMGGDAVESLLEKAEPRPAPPPQMERAVREAVRSEWAAVSGRRRRSRAVRNVAVAASVLLAVVFAFTNLQQTAVPMIEVATLEQSQGTIRLHGDDPGPMNDTSVLFAGQVLQTGADSAAGLAWAGGGSLRVDARSRIEFVSPDEIFLHSGRVYFDSVADDASGSFAVRTEHGLVSHVGTQYMAESSDARLVVSVREGRVVVSGNVHDQTVHHGQRAELSGASRPVLTNTSGVGEEWAWVEAVSPKISVDGMLAYDFLQWVGRETGHSIHFTSDAINQLTRKHKLRGALNEGLREELRQRMLTMDLDARFDPDNAVITVSEWRGKD